MFLLWLELMSHPWTNIRSMSGERDGGGQQQHDRLADEVAALRREVDRLRQEQDDLYSVLDTVAYLLERRIERALDARFRAAS